MKSIEELKGDMDLSRGLMIKRVEEIVESSAFRDRFKRDLINAIISSQYESIEELKAVRDSI